MPKFRVDQHDAIYQTICRLAMGDTDEGVIFPSNITNGKLYQFQIM